VPTLVFIILPQTLSFFRCRRRRFMALDYGLIHLFVDVNVLYPAISNLRLSNVRFLHNICPSLQAKSLQVSYLDWISLYTLSWASSSLRFSTFNIFLQYLIFCLLIVCRPSIQCLHANLTRSSLSCMDIFLS
jgi:hypothetical protein